MWTILGLLVTAVSVADPELKVIPQEGVAHPGQVYRIVCEVSWAGSPSDYAILPAEADPIDWGTVTESEMKAFVRSDPEGPRNIVSQTLEITPNKTGEFKAPEIRISYLNPEATPPAEKAPPSGATPGTDPSDSSASPSLRADPFTIVVRPDRFPVWLSGGLGASLLLTALGWWSVRRKHRPQPTPSVSGADLSGVQEALQAARQRRLDGNFYGYYLELARAAEIVSPEPQLAAALKARAQEVGYKGARPTDDQMEGDLRDVERALARYKETLQS